MKIFILIPLLFLSACGFAASPGYNKSIPPDMHFTGTIHNWTSLTDSTDSFRVEGASITKVGTVDGRDVSTDGATLDAISATYISTGSSPTWTGSNTFNKQVTGMDGFAFSDGTVLTSTASLCSEVPVTYILDGVPNNDFEGAISGNWTLSTPPFKGSIAQSSEQAYTGANSLKLLSDVLAIEGSYYCSIKFTDIGSSESTEDVFVSSWTDSTAWNELTITPPFQGQNVRMNITIYFMPTGGNYDSRVGAYVDWVPQNTFSFRYMARIVGGVPAIYLDTFTGGGDSVIVNELNVNGITRSDALMFSDDYSVGVTTPTVVGQIIIHTEANGAWDYYKSTGTANCWQWLKRGVTP
jgi:hypothetical protein